MSVNRAMLLLVIGCFFSCATTNATESQSATKEHSETSHEHPGKVQAHGKDKHSSGPVIPPKANHPRPVPNRGGGSAASGNAHAQAPVMDKASHTPNRGIVSSKPELAGSVTRSSRPLTLNRPSFAAASNVRHHGANPATIGGLTRNRPDHTAALSGSHLGRRP